MNSQYIPLFQPFTFHCGVQIRNRVLMAPTTTWSGNDDDTVSEGELDYYQARSAGLGGVITACGYVMPQGKGFHGQFGVDSDDRMPSLCRLATTIQTLGAKAILQLYHGGRTCPPEVLPNQQPLSASAIAPAYGDVPVPREMTEEEIVLTIRAFRKATYRALEAGFDGIELHGANGYLLQQFFSPHANRRTDRWGGSVEKRMAFPLAIVDEVINLVDKYARKPFVVGYRLSPEEIENPGITMSDTLAFVAALAEKKLDYLHISTLDFKQGSLRDQEDKKPRAVIIHERVGQKIPIIAVGGLHTPAEALQVLETGIPLVALARELIMEPQWMHKIEQDQVETIRTTLSQQAQQALAIPDGLWHMIMSRPGWLPVE